MTASEIAQEHGRVLAVAAVAGTSLAAAGEIEEPEETTRLHLILQGHKVRLLTAQQVDELRARFG